MDAKYCTEIITAVWYEFLIHGVPTIAIIFVCWHVAKFSTKILDILWFLYAKKKWNVVIEKDGEHWYIDLRKVK